jgi:pyruvate,orthophosphate dikinase
VQKAGIKVKPEVLIPLVGFTKELVLQVAVVHAAAEVATAEKKVKLNSMGRHDDRSPARRPRR